MVLSESAPGSENELHQKKMGLARRLVDLHQAGSTDQAPEPMVQSLDAYTDPARWRHEVNRIFKGLPLPVALSVELPEPGDYRAMTIFDVPLLMVRGKDGVVRAMINACRHRGAPVTEEGRGHKGSGRFSCPYHAWTYDDHGTLVSMFGQSTFGDVDPADLGLKTLPCAERSGLIWAGLTPGDDFDIDEWLGGFRAELDSLQLGDWHLYAQRTLDGPGWKVTWDGYLEGYHQQAVHPQTVGKNTIANLATWDTYGPHQRFVFARKSLPQLVDLPESQWVPDDHIRLIHSGFPNLSISGILGGHCLVSLVFPLLEMDKTVTIQTVLTAKQPETEAEKKAAEDFAQMALLAVRDEDYGMGFRIQAGLNSKGNEAFIFGRNEPTLQHYHRMVEKLSQ
jgi:phenylpropionate dioxygenase-like ring-hydroxylating dioxygenase large terminal subunit